MGAKENKKPTGGKAKPAKAENDSKQPWWFNQPLPIDRFTGWLVVWTFLLFLATTGLGVAAYFQYRALESTDHHIADQLETMRAGQRAWVTVEITPASDFTIINGEMSLTVKLKTKNIGQTTAINVRTWGKMVSTDTEANWGNIQRDFCTMEPRFFEGFFSPITTLFSTQSIEEETWVRTKAIETVFEGDVNMGKVLLPIIIGCVEYNSSIGPNKYKAGFTAWITDSRRDSSEVKSLTIDPTTTFIPQASVKLLTDSTY